MTTGEDPYRVESVDRALTLLALLREHGRLSVSQAAAELRVAPSTAHRLITTLASRGWAVQGEKRLYEPGPELVRTGAPPDTVTGLARRLRTALIGLFDTVGETVHLVVLVGADVRFVDGVEGEQPLHVGLRTGTRVPAHTTAAGRAMLAELPTDELESLQPGGVPPGPGGHAVTAADLSAELEPVRTRRFGLNQHDAEAGVTAVGASLGPAAGEHRAAITVEVPSARLDQAAADSIAAALLETCARVRAAR